ncbi:hypothetical protein CALCODRAFT_13944 [Calocera cornea HHB12733]|uniref:Uncharacterized protein n=1 Tax=Calocera cornea HHB12733 TaxID=1353952 RepID=A0A165EA51_9BASI|nr:hypothetical protein CALCODRAFT_13944 [Calocera cornea HHB12733]
MPRRSLYGVERLNLRKEMLMGLVREAREGMDGRKGWKASGGRTSTEGSANEKMDEKARFLSCAALPALACLLTRLSTSFISQVFAGFGVGQAGTACTWSVHETRQQHTFACSFQAVDGGWGVSLPRAPHWRANGVLPWARRRRAQGAQRRPCVCGCPGVRGPQGVGVAGVPQGPCQARPTRVSPRTRFSHIPAPAPAPPGPPDPRPFFALCDWLAGARAPCARRCAREYMLWQGMSRRVRVRVRGIICLARGTGSRGRNRCC